MQEQEKVLIIDKNLAWLKFYQYYLKDECLVIPAVSLKKAKEMFEENSNPFAVVSGVITNVSKTKRLLIWMRAEGFAGLMIAASRNAFYCSTLCPPCNLSVYGDKYRTQALIRNALERARAEKTITLATRIANYG